MLAGLTKMYKDDFYEIMRRYMLKLRGKIVEQRI
jgi:hypothetical protein